MEILGASPSYKIPRNIVGIPSPQLGMATQLPLTVMTVIPARLKSPPCVVVGLCLLACVSWGWEQKQATPEQPLAAFQAAKPAIPNIESLPRIHSEAPSPTPSRQRPDVREFIKYRCMPVR